MQFDPGLKTLPQVSLERVSSGMPSIEELQRARRVLGSVWHVRFDDIKYIDVTERFGLVTVAAGVRDVAVCGFATKNNVAQLGQLKEILDRHGLLSHMTRQVSPLPHERSEGVIGELAEVFDRVDTESYSRGTGRLLWVFSDPNRRDDIDRAVAREIQVGLLLGYPPCCVKREAILQNSRQRAFAAAIISAVGRDANAVERALREDLEVAIPADSAIDPNMLNTREHFPFVFHTACDGCLSSDQSRSVELNRSYEALATEVDRGFHRLFLDIAKLEVAEGRIFAEADKQGLRSGELEQHSNQRLQEIFRERDRLYARLFEP